MKKIIKIQTLIGAALFAASLQVFAIPSITGEIGMTGSFRAIKSDSTETTNLTEAVAIDFIGDQFTVKTATLDFSSLTIGNTGSITDFQFDLFSGPISNFWSIDIFSFELTTASKVFANQNVLLLEGVGVMSATGYLDTPGIWLFSGNTTGGSFAWSAGSTAVSEPGLLALLGIGLIGLAIRNIRKTKF